MDKLQKTLLCAKAMDLSWIVTHTDSGPVIKIISHPSPYLYDPLNNAAQNAQLAEKFPQFRGSMEDVVNGVAGMAN